MEVVHKPGKDILLGDYYSRHPTSCSERRCQICQFVSQLEVVGDTAIPMVNTISVEGVLKRDVRMPLYQRSAWLRTQKEDRVHRMLLKLIKTSQSPEPKKTKGDYTVLKRLHNMYRTGKLKISADVLVTVPTSDSFGNSYQAISVPTRFFPGLIRALHIRFDHHSKPQLQRLVARYFYSPGQLSIIDEVFDNCVTCTSLHAESETSGAVDGTVVEEPNVTENGTGTSEDKSDDSNVEELAVVDVNGNDPETGIESQLATRNGNDVTGNLWMQ